MEGIGIQEWRGKLAGQKDTDNSKEIRKVLNKIKEGLKIFGSEHIIRELKKGKLPHEVAGVDVPSNLVKDVGQAYKSEPREDYLPDDTANRLDKDPNLQNDIGERQKINSPEFFQDDISSPPATDKKPEEQESSPKEDTPDKKEPNDKPREDTPEEEKPMDNDETNKKDEEKNGEKASDSKKEDDKKSSENGEKGAKSGLNTEKMKNLANIGDATAKAAAGATASGPASAGGIFATIATTAGAGAPIWITILVIIIVVVIVVIVGPLLKSLGKEGHIQAQAYENSGQYNTTLAPSKFEVLKKALETNPDEFIKMIEKEKKLQNEKSKPDQEVIKICDDIIEKTKEMKELAPAGEEGADPDKKGDKEKIKVQILELTQKLVSKTSDIISIAMRELGVCASTQQFYDKEYNINDHWCAAFVQYVYKLAGIEIPKTDTAPTLYCRMKENPDKYITFEAGKGTPQAGDIVFFTWIPQHGKLNYNYCDPEIMHVGLVVKYDSGSEYVTTIEGNTGGRGWQNNCVMIKEKRYIQKQFAQPGARYFARVK